MLAETLKAKEKADKNFQDDILEVLGQLIVKHRLKSVSFYRYVNEYRLGNRKVDVPELDALNDFFKLHVRPEGFYAYWSTGKDWTRYRGVMV